MVVVRELPLEAVVIAAKPPSRGTADPVVLFTSLTCHVINGRKILSVWVAGTPRRDQLPDFSVLTIVEDSHTVTPYIRAARRGKERKPGKEKDP